jgi:hypothetical protein
MLYRQAPLAQEKRGYASELLDSHLFETGKDAIVRDGWFARPFKFQVRANSSFFLWPTAANILATATHTAERVLCASMPATAQKQNTLAKLNRGKPD